MEAGTEKGGFLWVMAFSLNELPFLTGSFQPDLHGSIAEGETEGIRKKAD